MNNLKTYLWLVKTNLFISTFTFGGGYVVVPMIQKYYVDEKKLFTQDELMDIAAIAQSTPGAIAINLTALAGYKVAKTIGLILSAIAAIIPPLVILSIISMFYSAFIENIYIAAILKGIQAGVAALIVDTVINMCQLILKERSIFLTLLIPISFIANFILDINVVLILVVSSLLCIIRVFYRKEKLWN